jgi:hypothetical protein
MAETSPRLSTRLRMSVSRRLVVIQLFLDFAANVAAQQDCEYLDQCADRGACCPARIGLGVVQHLPVQELEAQESAHPFAQR